MLDTVIGKSFASTLAPWISVQNVAQAIEFYQSAFGAVKAYCLEMPDGSVVVARLAVEGAEFWLGEDSEMKADPSLQSSGGPIRMILTVSYPDALFAQALAAGASEIYPVNESHGWRVGRLVDPFGHHWEIGRPLED